MNSVPREPNEINLSILKVVLPLDSHGSITGPDSANPEEFIRFRAVPKSGHVFDYWEINGITYTKNPIEYIMPYESLVVFAHFSEQPPTNPIEKSVFPANSGTISGPTSATAGDNITFTAVRQPGYQFSYWYIIGGGVQEYTENPLTIEMPRLPLYVRAYFVATGYVICRLVGNPPEGGIISGGGAVKASNTVNVSATPNPGYMFVLWFLADGSISYEPNTSFTMPARDGVCYCYFEKLEEYTITVLVIGEGQGSASGGGNYLEYSTCTVHARYGSGSYFAGWYDEEGYWLTDEEDYSFSVLENRTLYARFDKLPSYRVTLSSNPTKGGNTIGSGVYREGEMVQIKAEANPFYRFTSWSDGNTHSVRYLEMTQDYTLVANFEYIGLTVNFNLIGKYQNNGDILDFDSDEILTGTSKEYYLGDMCKVKIRIRNQNYKLQNWEDGSTEYYHFFLVTENHTVTAILQLVGMLKLYPTISPSTNAGSIVIEYYNGDTLYAATYPEDFPLGYIYVTRGLKITYSAVNKSSYQFKEFILNNITKSNDNPLEYFISSNPLTTSYYINAVFTSVTPSRYYHVSIYASNISGTGPVGDIDIIYKYLDVRTERKIKAGESLTLELLAGSTIYVTASLYSADETSVFNKWSNGITDRTTGILTLNSDIVFNAIYGEVYTVTCKAQPDNTGYFLINGEETNIKRFARNSIYNTTAIPRQGYEFVAWEDGYDVPYREYSPIRFNMTHTATFRRTEEPLTECTIEGVIHPNELYGSISGLGTYPYGIDVTVEAKPNNGYEFYKWDNGSTNPTRTIVNITNRIIHAYFRQIPKYDISILYKLIIKRNLLKKRIYINRQ